MVSRRLYRLFKSGAVKWGTISFRGIPVSAEELEAEQLKMQLQLEAMAGAARAGLVTGVERLELDLYINCWFFRGTICGEAALRVLGTLAHASPLASVSICAFGRWEASEDDSEDEDDSYDNQNWFSSDSFPTARSVDSP
eukprot:tig00020912_g15831.t1